MRPLHTLGIICAAVAIPTMAVAQPQALPRIVAGSELQQLIRGSQIGEFEPQPDWMNEIFRRDGTYREIDGARDGDVGTYYFSGNRFCIKIDDRETVRCRSVLIDSEKRTWLIEEGKRILFQRVRIDRLESSFHP